MKIALAAVLHAVRPSRDALLCHSPLLYFLVGDDDDLVGDPAGVSQHAATADFELPGAPASLISPHTRRAPALPVIFETKPFFGGPGSCAFELSPRPRSSGSAWTIMLRPMTLYGPLSLTRLSIIWPFARPVTSALMFPRSPTWRSLSLGPPWFLPKGL